MSHKVSLQLNICYDTIMNIHNTVKFNGKVSGTLQTSTSEGNVHSTMYDPVMSVESMNPSSATLDIVTYAIVGIAGFLSLLFIVILLGMILLYHRTKNQRRK